MINAPELEGSGSGTQRTPQAQEGPTRTWHGETYLTLLHLVLGT